MNNSYIKMASLTLRESRLIKSNRYDILLETIRIKKDLLFEGIVNSVEIEEDKSEELKMTLSEYIDNVKELKEIKKEIEIIDKKLETLTLTLDDRLESVCGRCLICSSSMMIPVKIICFECTCDITLCLDCVRSYLKLNQPYYNREYVGCLYCRVKNVIPRRAVDTYVIDYLMINKIDEEILKLFADVYLVKNKEENTFSINEDF
jgi:hypothetical protein